MTLLADTAEQSISVGTLTKGPKRKGAASNEDGAQFPPERADLSKTSLAKQPEERATVKTIQCLSSPWNRKHFDDGKMEELIESIQKHGVLQDVLVRPYKASELFTLVQRTMAEEARKQGLEVFEIIAGERRWRGASVAARDLPVKILRNCTDEEAIELQAIENLQREDPNPIEVGEKYQQLLEVYSKRGVTKDEAVAEICAKLSVGRSSVYDALRLIKLPEEIKKACLEGKLPASHAGLIAKLEHDRDVQLEVARTVLKAKRNDDEEVDREREEGGILSFRDTKELVAEREEFIRNRAEYNKKRAEFEAAGLRILTAKENAEYLQGSPNGDWWNLRYGKGRELFIKKDESCEMPGSNWREFSKLWKKAPPEVLGQLENGKPVVIYERKLAEQAVKDGGKLKKAEASGRATNKTDAELKAAAEERKMKKRFDVALKRVFEAERDNTDRGDRDEFWRFFATVLVGNGHSDGLKHLCKAQGWSFERGERAEFKQMKGSELRAICMQYLVADTCYPHPYFPDHKTRFNRVLSLYGIAPESLDCDEPCEAAKGKDKKGPVDAILEWLKARPGEDQSLRDIASGTGLHYRNVAIAFATKLKKAPEIRKTGPAIYRWEGVQTSGRKGAK